VLLAAVSVLREHAASRQAMSNRAAAATNRFRSIFDLQSPEEPPTCYSAMLDVAVGDAIIRLLRRRL
jgi:hypothetical protein